MPFLYEARYRECTRNTCNSLMTISITNSLLENKIDKALKKLPYKQSKVDFVVTGIDAYIAQLVK